MSDEPTEYDPVHAGAELALIGAATGDSEMVNAGFELLEVVGLEALFHACWSWAMFVVKQAEEFAPEGKSIVGFQLRDGAEHSTINPDETPHLDHLTWAGRFVVAVSLDDMENCYALFGAPESEQLSKSIMALLNMAAAYLRPMLQNGSASAGREN